MISCRILLADDSKAIRNLLCELLKDEFEIVGSVEDGRAAVQASIELKPNIVLLDVSMPVLNGIEAAREIHRVNKSILLVFVTQHNDRRYVEEAFRAGAMGYVIKQRVFSELRTALREILAGNSYGSISSVEQPF